MAKSDLQKTVEILFTANDDRFSTTVQGVGRSIQGLSGNVGSFTSPMADFTKSMLAAEAAVIGVGLAMAGTAVTQAGQFRESVKEIGTLFGGTADQVGLLQDQILEYSRSSTSSIEDINQAVYQAISTGTDWADAVQYVSDIETLATAGRESLASTTDLLAGSMNAYGAATSEAADYSDVLMVTVQKGATSLPQLASSLSGVTSIASAAGVSFADVNAAIAAMTASGTGTAESVTKLKALLTELLKPSDDLKAALGGVSLESDGLDGVMRKLMEVTGGSAEKMVQLFGSSEAVQGALTLANDSAGKYAESLQAMEERAGAAAAANAEMAEEFSNINQNLLNNIQATFVDAGLPLLDVYGEIVGEIANMFSQVSIGLDSDAFKGVYDSIDDAGERITNLLSGIAEALPEAMANLDLDVLLRAFQNLSESMGELFGDLDLTKAEDLERAIQFIVNGIAALTNTSAAAVDKLGPFIAKIADMVDKANSGESSLLDLVGSILGIGTIINTVLPSLDLLANAFIIIGGARSLGRVVPSMEAFVNVARSGGQVLPLLANPVTALAAGLAILAFNFNDVVTYVEEYISSLLDLETRAQRNTKETEALAKVFQENAKAMKGTSDEAWKTAEALWGNKEAAEGAAGAIGKNTDAVEGESEALKAYRQIAADTELMRKDFAEREEERAAQQVKQREELKRSTLELVEKYKDLTKGEWDLLDASTKAELSDARRLARQEGWLAAIEAEKKKREELEEQKKKDLVLQEKANDLLFRQTQQSLDFALALEKIYSDERMGIIELEFNLELEKLKQEGAQAEAIIMGINNTITSTGETLSNMASLLTGFNSTNSAGYRDMMQLVQNEEDRRDEALELQKKITEAQVKQTEAQTELLRAKAEAVSSGESLIRVEAANLTPALELIFDEVLRHTYLKATEEGQDFLLGLTN